MLLCEYVCVNMRTYVCMCLHMCHTTRMCAPTPGEVAELKISHQLSPQLYCSHSQFLARVECHKGEGRVLWGSEGAQVSVQQDKTQCPQRRTAVVQAKIN